MNGFYSVVIGLLVQFVVGLIAEQDEKYIVEPDFALFKQWDSSSKSRDFKIADQMVYEFEVDNASLPVALNLRVFKKVTCDRIRICLPYEDAQEYKLGKRYDLCVGRQTVDFNYLEGTLTLPDSVQMNLTSNFSNDDVLSFQPPFIDGTVVLQHGSSSKALSHGYLSKPFFLGLKGGDRFNLTFLQNRKKCQARLREVGEEGAVRLVTVRSVIRIQIEERKGYNLWAAVVALVGGSLLGGISVVMCQIKCRYTWYAGYYESLHLTYGYNNPHMKHDCNGNPSIRRKLKELVTAGGSNEGSTNSNEKNESNKQVDSKDKERNPLQAKTKSSESQENKTRSF